MIALLLATWIFNFSRIDCRGEDHAVARFSARVAYRDPNFYPCSIEVCDPLGNCSTVSTTCVAYTISAWNESTSLPVPDTGNEVRTEWDAPTPPLGAVTLIDIKAIDFFGVEDRGECPP